MKMAYEKSASEQEVFEFLEVAMTMPAVRAKNWALTAFGAYKELVAGTQPADAASCCSHSC